MVYEIGRLHGLLNIKSAIFNFIYLALFLSSYHPLPHEYMRIISYKTKCENLIQLEEGHEWTLETLHNNAMHE